MNANRIVYVGFAFSHHNGTHAGYHQIQNYVDYDYIVDCQGYYNACSNDKFNIFRQLWRKAMFRIIGVVTIPWYLLKCIWLGIKHDNLVFHFIYGENLYYPIKRYIRKNNKIVCTLHQPFAWFQENHKFSRKLRYVDAIILVGNSEVELFQKQFGKNRIFYIPHGISTEFYKPIANIKKDKILLTVGNWLRDFKFANDIYKRLLIEDEDLQIFVVSNCYNKQYLEKHNRLHFLTGITDEELRKLYLKSIVLFLPLIRYTANNSLLEAGATGCNIVISSNSLDNGYFPSEYVTLCPMQIDDTIKAIYKNAIPSYNIHLSRYVNKNYSWDVIGRKTYSLLVSM